MLKYLDINNLAIISQLSLQLEDGLCMVTGETGAGKSIMVDALKLALGDRADSRWLKDTSQQGEVTATFDVSCQTQVQQWLADQEVADGDQCLLRRVVKPNKGSRCFINQTPVPQQLARELGTYLVNIHSQHQYQQLVQYDSQRYFIDCYGGLTEQLHTVQQAYQQWKTARQTLDQLQANHEQREDRLQLLQYHVRELEDLNIKEGEVESLESEHKTLAHTGEIIQLCQSASQDLSGQDTGSASEQLQKAGNLLKQAQHYSDSSQLSNIMQLLESAQIQLDEASTELEHYLAELNLDPERLNEVQNRLSTIYETARKHNIRADELPELWDTLSNELASLQNQDEQIEEQKRQVETLESDYLHKARLLSEKRQEAGQSLSRALETLLHQLAMPHAKVDVEITQRQQYARHGLDQLRILVETNPGQALLPLHQAASGGELSRICLALQILVNQGHDKTTFIFDEVDVGIGGETAAVVGRMLADLGQCRQVLCITHLPQVASYGNTHYHVEKRQSQENTELTVQNLDEDSRVETIARMLGGSPLSEQSLAHARELLGFTVV